jgi:Uma2 family endonuclease
MGTMTTLPRSRPLTRGDLDTRPDDGHRYELIDGVLVVSPAPSFRHQTAVGRLWQALERERPADVRVLVAPFDVVLADDTVLQPDVLVARRADITDRDLAGPPLLAVEVLSPSTRRFDLMLKWSRYESAGCGSYWVVDPDEPALTAWDLIDGRYVETAHVTGTQPYDATLPFPVRVVPDDLVADI